jgi:hypothetical protein
MPVPEAVAQLPPPVAEQVHSMSLRPAGPVALTVASSTGFGPLLVTVVVHDSVPARSTPVWPSVTAATRSTGRRTSALPTSWLSFWPPVPATKPNLRSCGGVGSGRSEMTSWISPSA